MSFIVYIIDRAYKFIKVSLADLFCVPIIDVYHNGFWNYRDKLISQNKSRTFIYDAYQERNSSSIGLKSIFKSRPILPHGLHGIHVSDAAVIGHNVVIMQNVTIGSNTLSNTKNPGAPTIGDNVFFGANSTVIGKVYIGDNCRIGAGCCVFKDVTSNHTIVSGGAI